MKVGILFFIIASFVILGCENDKMAPFSLFKDSEWNLIENVVTVSLGDQYTLIIDSGSESANLSYFSQINDDSSTVIDSTLTFKELHAWNGYKGLTFEIIRVHLNFDERRFSSEDKLTVTAQHGNISESILFIVD